MRTILISGFFSGDGQRKKLEYFEKLDSFLRERGFRIFLFDWGPEKIESACANIMLPRFILTGQKIDGARFFEESALAEDVRHAASIEATIRACPLVNAGVKALYFRAYLRDLFLEHEPALCILWHQFNTFNYTAAHLCDEIGIPYVYAEYGTLPGTVCFERDGQMAESWVAKETDRFLELSVDDADLAAAERYLAYARQSKISRKDQAFDVDIDEVMKPSREAGRRVVFYAGLNDPATGVQPRSLPASTRHSPFFEDTHDALRHLSVLAEQNDWQILFKPHPILQGRVNYDDLPFPERVRNVVGANLFDCIEKTDVTVTIVSQVSYMALIHNRPVVLLGCTQLSGKGCLYEPRAIDETGATLEEALAHGFSSEQRRAWLRHVAQSLRYYLFVFDEEVSDYSFRGYEQAAEYLLECVNREPSVRYEELRRAGWGRWGTDLGPDEGFLKLQDTYEKLLAESI